MCYRKSIRVVSDITKDQYVVQIQARVLFTWVTFWSESCDRDDEDEIEYLDNCATEVTEKLLDSV